MPKMIRGAGGGAAGLASPLLGAVKGLLRAGGGGGVAPHLHPRQPLGETRRERGVRRALPHREKPPRCWPGVFRLSPSYLGLGSVRVFPLRRWEGKVTESSSKWKITLSEGER